MQLSAFFRKLASATFPPLRCQPFYVRCVLVHSNVQDDDFSLNKSELPTSLLRVEPIKQARRSADRDPQAPLGPGSLHPAWLEFIRFCGQLRHGEIDQLKIQDGLPLLAETVRQKIKFSR